MSTDERIKKITDIIIEWAEQKAEDGELKLDTPFCDYYSDHSTVRYWTSEMTDLIPDNSEGKDTGFKNPHHYAFEIECLQEALHLLFAFSYTDISDVTKIKCEEILEKYRMYRMADEKNPTGNFRRVCSFRIKIKNKSKEEIFNEMNKYFYEMKGYEEFICYKMAEEKKKKA